MLPCSSLDGPVHLGLCTWTWSSISAGILITTSSLQNICVLSFTFHGSRGPCHYLWTCSLHGAAGIQEPFASNLPLPWLTICQISMDSSIDIAVDIGSLQSSARAFKAAFSRAYNAMEKHLSYNISSYMVLKITELSKQAFQFWKLEAANTTLAAAIPSESKDFFWPLMLKMSAFSPSWRRSPPSCAPPSSVLLRPQLMVLPVLACPCPAWLRILWSC